MVIQKPLLQIVGVAIALLLAVLAFALAWFLYTVDREAHAVTYGIRSGYPLARANYLILMGLPLLVGIGAMAVGVMTFLPGPSRRTGKSLVILTVLLGVHMMILAPMLLRKRPRPPSIPPSYLGMAQYLSNNGFVAGPGGWRSRKPNDARRFQLEYVSSETARGDWRLEGDLDGDGQADLRMSLDGDSIRRGDEWLPMNVELSLQRQVSGVPTAVDGHQGPWYFWNGNEWQAETKEEHWERRSRRDQGD